MPRRSPSPHLVALVALAGLRVAPLLVLASGCDAGEDTLLRGAVGSSHAPVVTRPVGSASVPDPETPNPTPPEGPDSGTPDSGTPDSGTTDPTPPEAPDPATTACEGDVICVDAFPFVDSRDSRSGPRRLDAYSCAPSTREGGPELVYKVELPADGLLVASLSDLAPGVDVDVHILDDLDPAACRDRGHWNAAARLGAGTAWVVVDTWLPADADPASPATAGPYTLTLGFTSAETLEPHGLDRDVLDMALHVFDRAWQRGDTDSLVYTVIDFALHSAHPRLWTLDLTDGSLLFAEPVTHGAGSEDPANRGYAWRFSNVEGSHQSSLGLMRTAARYISSSNGLSLRLDGLDAGVNDQVRNRAIVVHSDPYASAAFLAANGRLGNSWGCQVIDPVRIDDFIGTIEDGTLMWSHFPDDAFLGATRYLDGY
jgi:hypothetical protein